MNSAMKSTEKRTENRRTVDRRKADLAFAGNDRRVAERRASSDRRT